VHFPNYLPAFQGQRTVELGVWLNKSPFHIANGNL
jgi:hypothetical protein